MKYDRDGNPLKNKELTTNPELSASSAELMVEKQTQNDQDMVENQTQNDELVVENQTEVEDTKPEPVKQSAPAESWKILREKAQKAEKERDEAIRYAKEIEARTKASPEIPEEDYSVNVEEDSLVEGKHLSKVNKHIKKLEEQLKSYQQQTAMNATESKLKSQYPDFDTVVCKENLESLRYAYPEIANTINSSTDLYSKAVSAYTMIKKLGITNEDIYAEDKALAQKNASKPKPLASVSPQQGDSPLSKANAFANGKITDDLKKQLWREMNEIRKG